MPTVEFEEANISCNVEEGVDLRSVAYKNKVSVYGGVNKLLNCRGFGLCGTDQIKASPKDCLSAMTWKEKLHLDEKSGIRLACQARVIADAKVSVAPAIEYGNKMKEDIPVLIFSALFGLASLFFIVFMAFELVGKPLF